MMADNAKTLENGLAKALVMIEDALVYRMRGNVITLLHKACINREFQGFTGNTQTSYMGGIYVNGSLKDIITQRDYQQPPNEMKISGPARRYKKNPYEGKPRFMTAKVKTSREYGDTTSMKFLKSYKAPKNYISIVITTGTEYSEYLEQIRGLDVLTKTWEQASKVLLSSMKPIKF